MRAYPLTEDQLENLAQLGVFTTLAFSFGSALLGFGAGLHKDLSLAKDVAQPVLDQWSAIRTGTLIGAGVAYFAGIGVLLLGKSRLDKIKQNTTFESGRAYEAPSWPKRIGFVVLVFVCVGTGFLIRPLLG